MLQNMCLGFRSRAEQRKNVFRQEAGEAVVMCKKEVSHMGMLGTISKCRLATYFQGLLQPVKLWADTSTVFLDNLLEASSWNKLFWSLKKHSVLFREINDNSPNILITTERVELFTFMVRRDEKKKKKVFGPPFSFFHSYLHHIRGKKQNFTLKLLPVHIIHLSVHF